MIKLKHLESALSQVDTFDPELADYSDCPLSPHAALSNLSFGSAGAVSINTTPRGMHGSHGRGALRGH